jgi:hypothetical protein
MSDKNKMQVTKNPNKRIDLIEEAISKNDTKYYEYNIFMILKKLTMITSEKSIVQIGKI